MDTKELRKLAEGATQGKWPDETWCSDFECNGRWAAIGPIHKQRDSEDEIDPNSDASKAAENDAAYIAACNPKTLLQLLDRIERLEKNQTAAWGAFREIAYMTGQHEDDAVLRGVARAMDAHSADGRLCAIKLRAREALRELDGEG